MGKTSLGRFLASGPFEPTVIIFRLSREEGASQQQLLAAYPGLSTEAINALLAYASGVISNKQ